MTDDANSLVPAAADFIVDVGDDGATHFHVRLGEGAVSLTQKLLAARYGVSLPTINEHLRDLYQSNELGRGASIRNLVASVRETEVA